jgi:hypothetical protein
MNAW